MDKKRILIFAHYYYPDIASTGQILKDQAEGMLDKFVVTVICTVPSYDGKVEDKYKTKKYYFENINGVRVVRVRVPEFKKTSKISRIRNIAVYFGRALKAVKYVGEQDYIFTISQPPILGGLLGVCGKRIKKAKMIYCIQDFNPEQIMAIKYYRNVLMLKIMMWLDKYSCRQSDLIVTVGRDLVETLQKRFCGKKVPKYVMINNWIDDKEIYPLSSDHEKVAAFRKQYCLDGKFVIMYSGNIGLYYDLENIIKVIKKFKNAVTVDGRNVAFVFVGAGSLLEQLQDYVMENHMTHVVFIPYQDKNNLIFSLNASDVHWCVNAKGIKGVSCPSKWYGQAAVAKPVLGVLEKGSEIRLLIEKTRNGLVCEPGDYATIEKNIQWFLDHADSETISDMGKNGYRYLTEHLRKDMAIDKYIKSILETNKIS